MRTLSTWRVAALAGALLWGACSKEEASAPAPAPKPAAAPTPAAEPESEPEAEAEEPKPQAAAPAAPKPQGEPPVFKLGQSRSEVMELFAGCGERRIFLPGGNGALYVEVFQPKETEECLQWLGKRYFTIRGGELHAINDGLIPRPAEGPPSPEGS